MLSPKMTHAIIRPPGPGFAEGITSADMEAPDLALAQEQHRHYVDALKSLGLEVKELAADSAYPDGCFVEDVAVLTPEFRVLTHPGAPSRRAEVDSMAPVLEAIGPLDRIEAPGTMDGGDVLLVGREFFVGISKRTNQEGFSQFERIATEHGYQCHALPVTLELHLKCCVTALGDQTLVVTSEFVDQPALAAYQKILVEDSERYAANMLWIRGRAIMPKGYPRTRDKVKALGFELIELDMSEFRKMQGALTCLSLRY
jgi:dimethylargininase